MNRRFLMLTRFLPVALSLGQLSLGCNGSADGAIVLDDETGSATGERNPTTADSNETADSSWDAAAPNDAGGTASASASASASDTGGDDAGSESPAASTATAAADAGATSDVSPPPPASLDWGATERCVYRTPPGDAPAIVMGTDAGAPEAGPHVTLPDSDFLGAYLADHNGYTLYIYTADFPGDCESPPISTCFDDCLIAWPIFEAGPRVLAEGLDDSAFGTFIREDGIAQTTYYGWPLYYYKKDLEAEPGAVLGQGKGKVWYVAEDVLPNLVIMRAPEQRDGVRYLADEAGYTLYRYVGDTAGTEQTMPNPACVGDCLNDFMPFRVRSLRAVTELDPNDLSIFIRSDGAGAQVSYRGQPLYLHINESRSGEMEGLLVDGFELAVP